MHGFLFLFPANQPALVLTDWDKVSNVTQSRMTQFFRTKHPGIDQRRPKRQKIKKNLNFPPCYQKGSNIYEVFEKIKTDCKNLQYLPTSIIALIAELAENGIFIFSFSAFFQLLSKP